MFMITLKLNRYVALLFCLVICCYKFVILLPATRRGINANRGVVPELRWVSSLSSVERQKIG